MNYEELWEGRTVGENDRVGRGHMRLGFLQWGSCGVLESWRRSVFLGISI